MDSPGAPEQLGVLLVLPPGTALDLADVRRLIAERLPALPRLRQRLTPVPLGCGGPIWVDDPAFDIRQHVREQTCPGPGADNALADAAFSVVKTPLPHNRPLWSVVLLTGPTVRALVAVLHHGLADGIGGLDVLSHLVDGAATGPGQDFPRPAPSRGSLAGAAFTDRWRALRRVAQAGRLLRRSLDAGGGLRPPRVAASSLNGPTRSIEGLAVVTADHTGLRAAAHSHGSTTNDAILVGVAGALHRLLRRRGEHVDPMMVTVPVSGRGPDAATLGNMVSPMLVQVPTSGTTAQRLQMIAAQVRANRVAATAPPPIAVLGWLFRPCARLGGFRWYMRHQRRFHTLVTFVHGPTEPVAFGGWPVTAAIPMAIGPGGNVRVYVEVLSYAGRLHLTAVVDAGTFPDVGEFAALLGAELDQMVDPGGGDFSG
jgi:WS/DGAT/MGAT family acyltransferase